jgi:hypothetical protein
MAPSRSYPTGNRVLGLEDEHYIAALFAEMVQALG